MVFVPELRVSRKKLWFFIFRIYLVDHDIQKDIKMVLSLLFGGISILIDEFHVRVYVLYEQKYGTLRRKTERKSAE